MSVFYHEDPPNSSKRCKFLLSFLKDIICNFQKFSARLSNSRPEEEYPIIDFKDEEVFISEIRSRAIEKLRKKPTSLLTDNFSLVYSPITNELYITAPKEVEQKEETEDEKEDEGDEFLSVKSCFTCSSAASIDTFLSVKTNFSTFSGLLDGHDVLGDQDYIKWRLIIQDLCHCEGWPFGLCRKALLLPPLPKSPAESWSWRKKSTVAKKPYCYGP